MYRYYLKTFGCQMNYNDSERMRTILHSYSFFETDTIGDADIIIFNSCAVRQKAEDKLLGFGNQITPMKKNPKKDGLPIVVLTGCMVKTGVKGRVRGKSVVKLQKKWLNQVTWLDYAVPIDKVFTLLEKVLGDLDIGTKKQDDNDLEYLDIPADPYSVIQASVPISTGCNHHCAYCTVPYSRGEERFREFNKILNEYKGYIDQNFKQITLLGQVVNKWLNPNYNYKSKDYSFMKCGGELPFAMNSDGLEPENFLQLIKILDKIDGDYWLNFLSSYPNYYSDELIEYILQSIKSQKGHIMPWIHMAVQSGSNKILRSMNRHNTIEEFIEIVNKFRKIIPEISITTDIIVGFPGETLLDFRETIDLVEEIEFDMIFIAEYSPRPDTPAEKLGDPISKDVKSKRKKKLNDILEKKLFNRNKNLIGKERKVLVTNHYKNKYIGKDEYGKDVSFIAGANDLIGQFVIVNIVDADAWGITGELKN